MKALMVIVITVLFSFQSSAQKLDPASIAKLSPEKRDEVNGYLHKAKNAKTTALVLCIGGGTLAIAGMAVVLSELGNDVWFDGQDPTSSAAGPILFYTGAAAALASIPFFVNIHKQRNNARAVLYQDKGVSIAPKVTLPNTRSFGLRIIVPIGK
ncbi:hypothetical protein BH10BAC3_BH10BAC3_27320 [soil metagenome]